jgi:hypothetical protein
MTTLHADGTVTGSVFFFRSAASRELLAALAPWNGANVMTRRRENLALAKYCSRSREPRADFSGAGVVAGYCIGSSRKNVGFSRNGAAHGTTTEENSLDIANGSSGASRTRS